MASCFGVVVDKFCKKCQTLKAVEEFTFRSRKEGTRRPECRKCTQLYQLPSRKRTKLKQRYRMRLEGWQGLYEMQKARCAICERETELHVDHDHEFGMIRGLLCPPCNLSLGLLKEDPVRINALAAYAQTCQDLRSYRRAIAESREETLGGRRG